MGESVESVEEIVVCGGECSVCVGESGLWGRV